VNDDDAPDETPVPNRYLHVAMAAKCLSYPAGSNTWAFKQLSGVLPSDLSSELIRKLEYGNCNYFKHVGGRNITMIGKVCAGEWIDVIRGRDWLQNDMQLRLFKLMVASPIIHFTNSGIAKVQNEMIASLKEAQVRGIIAENEFNADGELILGFATNVPNAQSIPATQKAERVLRGCTFAARLSGAIHVIDVHGSLAY
jgi:hypothetical protein